MRLRAAGPYTGSIRRRSHQYRTALAAGLFLCGAWCALAWQVSERQKAEALYKDRQFAAAAAVLTSYVATNPADHAARLLLGLSLQQAGQLREAEAVFREGARLRPRDASSQFFLARTRFLLGRFAEAEESARAALRVGEPVARVQNLIGLIRAEQNQHEQALAAFRAAASADAKYPDPHLNAGVELLKVGRAAEAERSLTAALQLQPTSAEARYQRARAYLELSRRPEAEDDLAQAASRGHEPSQRLLRQLRAGGVQAARRSPAEGGPLPVRFEEVAAASGLRFVLENSPTAEKRIIETMAGGVAAFDFDHDGWTDVFFTNGASVPDLAKNDAKYQNRLFRNEGGRKFRDATESSGLGGRGYSIGAAAADYDNDGNVDLFVAGVRQNLLYRNLGAGRFEEVSAQAGIASARWSVAAAWLDYDRDGLLDLFVVNYLDWQSEREPFCGDDANNFRIYCHPRHYDGSANTLYRNLGGGRFEDVSEKAGIAAHNGKGMSVGVADYDGDGYPDLFVSNDTQPNFLFHNRGDGTFEEAGMNAGAALTDDGKAVSSMGVEFQDYDNDGLPDILVTALTRETFPLFRNNGRGYFRDATSSARMAVLSAPFSGWGVGLVDFNNDGWKDVFTANAHVTDNIEAFSTDRYRQVNSVFLNDGAGRFVAAKAGFDVRGAHRGAAFADFDQDGRMDVVVSALGAPAELWRNVSEGGNAWLILKLQGTRSNRDGIGARVRVGEQHRFVTSAAGYASSSHAGIHFGLGTRDLVPGVEITWPSGEVQVLRNVRTRQILEVREPAAP